MKTVVLDASAVIALVKQEVGADRVAAILTHAIMGAVNYSEVVGHLIRSGMSVDLIGPALDPLNLQVVPVDRDLAVDAGLMQATTAVHGLSIADRLCLALARRERTTAWTADKMWRKVADAVGVEVELIR